MRFTFLGTGTSQGIPVIGCDCDVCSSPDPRDKRLRCSLLIESQKSTIAIDVGPDFRQQMLRAGVRELDAILITHDHMDHTAGLDEVRAFNFMQNKPMKVFCSTSVQQRLRQQYSYIFDGDPYPGKPRVEFGNIGEDPIDIGDIHILPITVMHGKLPVQAFRIMDFTYVTDANYISPKEKLKIKGSKILALNSLKKEKHHSHFSLSEAISISKELEVVDTYLIHISHVMGPHKEVSTELPQGVQLAYDGLSLEL